jgi:RNA polymerase sigma-70 factor, ECF subfamily
LGKGDEGTARRQLYPGCFACTRRQLDGWMKKIGLYDQDDGQVVRQVIAGEINAFERLVERHGALVSAIVKKHVPFDDVEDTIQDVFLRAYRSLPGFKNRGSFGQWLSVIAVRTCHDFWRERYKSKELPVSALTEQNEMWLASALSDASNGSFLDRASQKEAGEVLDYALGKLTAGDRMALELVYLEGRTIKEAAHLLGWSAANVKVRLFRSKKKLHKVLMVMIDDERSKG